VAVDVTFGTARRGLGGLYCSCSASSTV